MKESDKKELPKTIQRIRIVNKSKDGITLDFKGEVGLKKSSWEEFNKLFVICEDDKIYCTMNKKWLEKMSKTQELIQAALIFYLQVDWKIADPNQVPDLIHMGVVGEYVKKISEVLECSFLEAMSYLNYAAIQFRASGGPNDFKGLGADKLPKKDKNKKPSNPPKSTNKLGDFNPELARLKEQLESNEKKGK